MNLDITKLVKLLNMTFSENDHEKLVAINSANKMLLKAGVLWDTVLVSLEHKTGSDESELNDEDIGGDDIIFASIDYIKCHGLTRNIEFATSVEDFYINSGYLTHKQISVLIVIIETIHRKLIKSQHFDHLDELKDCLN